MTGLEGLSILILEDTLLIALELEDALAAVGARTVTCATVAEARDALRTGRFDFILTDYFLDEGVSLPLIEDAVAAGLPFALLTGYQSDETGSVAARASGVFVKPFSTNEIIDHIAAALGRFQGGGRS